MKRVRERWGLPDNRYEDFQGKDDEKFLNKIMVMVAQL